MKRIDQKTVCIRFGKSLRERRLGLELSQEELGSLAGLDRTYISGIERGKRNVAILNLSRLAKALKCSISELMSDV